MSYCFIKNAIEGNERAHKYFIRFGKGKFDGRAALKVNVRSNNLEIRGSFENVPSILAFISSLSLLNVSGKILSKNKIDEKLTEVGLEIINLKDKKNILEYEVKGEIKKGDLEELENNTYFLLLDAQAEGIKFKCKKNLPKPSSKGEIKIDDKFFSLTLEKKYFDDFKREFLFDVKGEGKKIDIVHSFVIEKIIIPKELEKSEDFELIRQKARRKGKIIRKIKIDKKEEIKEYSFEV